MYIIIQKHNFYPLPTRSICEDTLVGALVIPSTCIWGRDIVIASLVRMCVCVCVCLSVCLSVCLHLIAS